MTDAYACALRLLTRREHGRFELLTKLIAKGYDEVESKTAVEKCVRLDLQSDKRMTEMVCHARFAQGYGPLRIIQELQAKAIDKELIHSALQDYEDQWEEKALSVWQKKFRVYQPSLTELKKQQRYLLYRGFSSAIVGKILKQLKA